MVNEFDLGVLHLGRLVHFLRSVPWPIPSSGRRRAFWCFAQRLHSAASDCLFFKTAQSARSMREAPCSFPPPTSLRPPCLLKLIRPPALASAWQLARSLARKWLKMQFYLCALCLFSLCVHILIAGE